MPASGKRLLRLYSLSVSCSVTKAIKEAYGLQGIGYIEGKSITLSVRVLRVSGKRRADYVHCLEIRDSIVQRTVIYTGV